MQTSDFSKVRFGTFEYKIGEHLIILRVLKLLIAINSFTNLFYKHSKQLNHFHMKNLFYIPFLLLIFSCGGEAKTEQNQAASEIENIPNSSAPEASVLAKNDIKEGESTAKTSSNIPAENISSKETNTSKSDSEKTSTSSIVKNEAKAKAQIEAEKAKALAKKIQLDEEMKKAEETKKAKAAAEAKAQLEAKKANTAKKEKEQKLGSLFEPSNKKSTSETALHDEFDALLKKHVSSSGKVSYKGFKNDEGKLDSYLQKLEKTSVEKSWSRNKKLAFWINAYNANTIKLILKNYPIKSIMDLHNGKPWDAKWIKIDQRTLSLNNIENDIIRPKFNEPRIHFAVNCAAKSCPPLLNKAWTASNLNSNFERQTKSFINNSNYNSITSGNVEVSKIFDWYGKDFGDLRAYLNKYSKTTISSGTSINFKSYNWDLNK